MLTPLGSGWQLSLRFDVRPVAAGRHFGACLVASLMLPPQGNPCVAIFSCLPAPQVSHPLDMRPRPSPAVPDLTTFPKLSQAVGYEAQLAPGDCLFLPKLWFHEIHTVGGDSTSLSFWFEESSVRVSAISIPLLPHRLFQLARDTEFLLVDLIGARRVPGFLRMFLEHIECECKATPHSPLGGEQHEWRAEWSTLQQTLLLRLGDWLGGVGAVLRFCSDFLHPARFEGLDFAASQIDLVQDTTLPPRSVTRAVLTV